MSDEKKSGTSAGKGDTDGQDNDGGPLAGMDIKMQSPGAAEVDSPIVKSSADMNHTLHELHDQVFGNYMLRENILRAVIYPFDGESDDINRKCLGNLRLVQKSWLGTVTTILKKFEEPLFLLTLNKENSVEGTPYCNDHGKLLDTFNNCLSNDVLYDPGEVPTFSLRLLPDFFRRENYENLSRCLTQLGDGLTELNLSFPVSSSMTFIFPHFTLPRLNKLTVQFTNQLLPHISTQLSQYNGHALYPLQTILNTTSVLMKLRFKRLVIPFGLEYLILPKTITTLHLDCHIENQDLELLLKNDLPNLYYLRLFGTFSPFAEGLFHQVLSKYRTTLRALDLDGFRNLGRNPSPKLFRFPLMEKLETLTVTSPAWELDEDIGNPTQVNRNLPALRKIWMMNQRETQFRKWVSKSKYESVKDLCVSLITQTPAGTNGMVTFNLERMQMLNLAFPNVTYLEVTVCGNQTCGLKYLFMEMRKLVELSITYKEIHEHLDSIHWDSLFVGFPPDVIRTIKRHPDFCRELRVGVIEKYPSIQKLTELTSLSLLDDSPSPSSSQNFPFISDLSFHFAFLKMTNLKDIELSGRFKVSVQIMDQWRQEKGTDIVMDN